MKMSKYLCAVALIVSVAGCQSATSTSVGSAPSSTAPSNTKPSTAPTPSVPLLPPVGRLTRVAELSYSGGLGGRNDLAVPAVVAYSDGTVVFNGQKRLTFTPGALDVLVSTLQKDLSGQPTTTVLQPSGHAIADATTTVLGVYQPGGSYQTVSALGLDAGTASGFPAPVADAFAKLQTVTSDATTPYTTTRVRYSVTCPSGTSGPEQPWPKAVPQPGAGQPNTCEELRTLDGAAADAVRAACTDVNTRQPQPATVVYRTASGPRICRWRYALPDETPSS
jgi:hypothetical protein